MKQGGIDKFKNVLEEFGSDTELTELMTRKGIYPYNFMDGYDKFDVDPLTLTKLNFRNDLTGEDISDCDFEFYKEICSKFNIKTLGQYHDLILKIQMFFYYVMYSKASEKPVINIINWIQSTITVLLV